MGTLVLWWRYILAVQNLVSASITSETKAAILSSLAEIADAVGQLNEAVTHTLTAVRSDALISALDVYSAVKTNKSKVPGLNSVADNLSRYFAKSPRASASVAK